MAGKTGEAALHEKLEQIKLDYTALVEKIKSENVKAAADLEKKLFKDEEEFKARQERERREFEARMEEEKGEFKEKQLRERDIADSEASHRLKQAEEFIENVRSPVVKDKHKLGHVDIGNELECPVCFQEMSPPLHIWQCAQGHPVCEPCKLRPEVRYCPTCRQRIVGRATLVEKIAAQVFSDKQLEISGSPEETSGLVESSLESSPVSSPEPSFRPRLPTYFLSLRNGTRIGNEDYSLNSLRDSRRPLDSSPLRVLADSDTEIADMDFATDSRIQGFGFLD